MDKSAHNISLTGSILDESGQEGLQQERNEPSQSLPTDDNVIIGQTVTRESLKAFNNVESHQTLPSKIEDFFDTSDVPQPPKPQFIAEQGDVIVGDTVTRRLSETLEHSTSDNEFPDEATPKESANKTKGVSFDAVDIVRLQDDFMPPKLPNQQIEIGGKNKNKVSNLSSAGEADRNTIDPKGEPVITSSQHVDESLVQPKITDAWSTGRIFTVAPVKIAGGTNYEENPSKRKYVEPDQDFEPVVSRKRQKPNCSKPDNAKKNVSRLDAFLAKYDVSKPQKSGKPKQQDKKLPSKVKIIRKSKTVKFDLDKIKAQKQLDSCSSRESSNRRQVLGKLQNSPFWICSTDTAVFFLNHYRADENYIFDQLLETHSLASERLACPVDLRESPDWDSSLNEALGCLECDQEGNVADPRLTFNGFKVTLDNILSIANLYIITQLMLTVEAQFRRRGTVDRVMYENQFHFGFRCHRDFNRDQNEPRSFRG